MSRIKLPSEFKTDGRMMAESKKIDEACKTLYSELLESVESHSPSDVVDIIASVRTEQVAALIGENLTEHDKKVLYGLIERHIAGIVISE